MLLIRRILLLVNNALQKFIYKRMELFMIVFAILSFFPPVSYLSILFFVWNFFNKKSHLRPSLIFFTIAIAFNILYFAMSPWADEVQKKWDIPGRDKEFEVGLKNTSQIHLNIVARKIEKYKSVNGSYPNNLNQIQDGFTVTNDDSYRVRQNDGQVNGVPFYYEKLDSNKYFLAGVGKDGKIKTEDDLIPQIWENEEKTTGLIKYKIKPRKISR